MHFQVTALPMILTVKNHCVDLPILAAGLLILMFITPKTPIWIFLIGIACVGAGTSCLGIVSNALMPDLPEVDEMIHGLRRVPGVQRADDRFRRAEGSVDIPAEQQALYAELAGRPFESLWIAQGGRGVKKPLCRTKNVAPRCLHQSPEATASSTGGSLGA